MSACARVCVCVCASVCARVCVCVCVRVCALVCYAQVIVCQRGLFSHTIKVVVIILHWYMYVKLWNMFVKLWNMYVKLWNMYVKPHKCIAFLITT